MSADQNDLIREIRPRDFADDIESASTRGLFIEFRLDVQFDFYRDVVIEQPHHAVVVLDCQSDFGHSGAISSGSSGSNKDGTCIEVLLLPGEIAAACGQIVITAAIEQCNDTFFLIKL